jgi:hypothetical protein
METQPPSFEQLLSHAKDEIGAEILKLLPKRSKSPTGEIKATGDPLVEKLANFIDDNFKILEGVAKSVISAEVNVKLNVGGKIFESTLT